MISGRRLRQQGHCLVAIVCLSCAGSLGLIGLISGVEWTGYALLLALGAMPGPQSLTHRHQLCPKVSHSSHHCTALAVGARRGSTDLNRV